MAERDLLERGLKALDLDLSETQTDLLLRYLALLVKWNRAYNLTAIRDPQEMVIKHLLDSLTVVPYITRQRLLDVGTGAGLPGIPLAIVYPDKQFELLDSNGKKTRFLTQVVAELGLPNVRVHNLRIESGQLEPVYEGILSRAFASLADMTRDCGPLLIQGGELLAMKGVYPTEELSQLPKPYIVKSSHALAVPGLTGDRHLIKIGLPE
ncbi:16S rRNA (guanine527-N7)-methyltransferase [Litorivivens lipolytica]|uniref:Ribosomal RNA small subunit methyltransferase G n=1 Tax=Litorivivens lipolytica TaxID=1524264 RepID=A0A7W4W770_9GAMM|nr:16S rRNA (guanine(527)-N(7))-methyltransferase RsmG [Litorivivens lipolytica]MBB3048684.1 16S rRNA (guanine527-N7)-methyltransferase [Litorivivens lipolytica]